MKSAQKHKNATLRTTILYADCHLRNEKTTCHYRIKFINNYLQMYKTLQPFTSLFTEITNIHKFTNIFYKYKSY